MTDYPQLDQLLEKLHAIPLWCHFTFAVFVLLLIIPQFIKPFFSKFLAVTFSKGYNIAKYCMKKPTEEEKQIEQDFKATSVAQVQEQLKKEYEYVNMNGFVQFKWGFPYIFRSCHIQLYKTLLLIRDGNKMKQYNKKRVEMANIIKTSQPMVMSEESKTLINSQTLPPPKPMYTFNLSRGKCLNSRIPMTLKCVSINSDICYLQFKDKKSYADWAKAICKNLHVEIAEGWKRDADIMHKKWQQDQHLQ